MKPSTSQIAVIGAALPVTWAAANALAGTVQESPAKMLAIALTLVCAAAIVAALLLWLSNQELRAQKAPAAPPVKHYARQPDAKDDVAESIKQSHGPVIALGTRMDSFADHNQPFHFVLQQRDREIQFYCMDPNPATNTSHLMLLFQSRGRDIGRAYLESTRDNILKFVDEADLRKKDGLRRLDVFTYNCENSFRLILTDDHLFLGFVDQTIDGKQGVMFRFSRKETPEFYRAFQDYIGRLRHHSTQTTRELLSALTF